MGEPGKQSFPLCDYDLYHDKANFDFDFGHGVLPLLLPWLIRCTCGIASRYQEDYLLFLAICTVRGGQLSWDSILFGRRGRIDGLGIGRGLTWNPGDGLSVKSEYSIDQTQLEYRTAVWVLVSYKSSTTLMMWMGTRYTRHWHILIYMLCYVNICSMPLVRIGHHQLRPFTRELLRLSRLTWHRADEEHLLILSLGPPSHAVSTLAYGYILLETPSRS
jgi:hypothetical protein